jgi:DNA-binding response OmpR family regulator
MLGAPPRPFAQKVLVVDADPQSVHETGAVLRSQGYEPIEATSFEAARALWVSEHPPILIADVRLGQFNGLQLLLRARADRPDVAVLITCAAPDKVLEEETRRFGGMFAVKPLSAETIATTLQALLSRQKQLPNGVEERRATERRQTVLSNFLPERRHTERRR